MPRLASTIWLILVLGGFSTSDGKTVFVDAGATGDGSGLDWSNACTTITAGLTLSATEDEVWVKSATYEEAVSLREGVALYGGFPSDGTPTFEDRDWAANATVIAPAGIVRSAVSGADGGGLDGFLITGVVKDSSSVIECDNASPRIANCAIRWNSAGTSVWNGIVVCRHQSSPVIINCAITGNTAEGGGVVTCSFSSSPALINCTIAGNSGFLIAAVASSYESFPELTNCILWNDGSEIAGWGWWSWPEVQFSCVQGGGSGEWNVNGNPLFIGPENGDYRLRDGSSCIDRGVLDVAPEVDLDGRPRPGGDGLVDMGAYEAPDEYEPGPAVNIPAVFHVRADAAGGGDGLTWESAFSSIGAAMEVATTQDEVWVAGGVYAETVHMERGVSVYGGFAGTELSCDQRNWLAYPSIIDVTGMQSSAVIGADSGSLDGFTITGGEAENGGGVYCLAASPTLRRCFIVGNSASEDGGGLYGYDSSPVLEDCVLSLNRAVDSGGGADFLGGSPKLLRCSLTDNKADYSGGIRLYDAYCFIVGCTIERNSAQSAAGLSSWGDLTLDQCSVSRNSATGETGGLYAYGSAIIRDCSFVGNSAARGGGLQFYDPRSQFNIERCVIADSTATDEGGGIYCDFAHPRFRNCLIARNAANLGGAVFAGNYSSPDLFNCTIADNSARFGVGGGLYLNPSECDPWEGADVVVNSIVWNNIPDQIAALNPSCTPEVTWCDVSGGWPGAGNIDATPEFVHPWDGTYGDFRLLPSSSCIDAGNNEAATGMLTDLDGNVRIWDGDDVAGAVIDMGAYEYGSVSPDQVTPSPTPTLAPSPTPTPIVGDMNGDGRLDDMDLFLFSREWQKSQ